MVDCERERDLSHRPVFAMNRSAILAVVGSVLGATGLSLPAIRLGG